MKYALTELQFAPYMTTCQCKSVFIWSTDLRGFIFAPRCKWDLLLCYSEWIGN